MHHEITRHFATIDGRWGPRQVHYRRAGQGPAVLLLHQSPQSSAEMVDLMGRWALHFTVIAPDTPGYGQSDPLGPTRVPMADFAHALLEFADAIGLRRFGLYGYHTGSSIGTWLAARHPERVTALAANGLVQLTEAERRDILAHYLPPLVPTWDGAHLAWMWARLREQTVFFPWYRHNAAARMELDMPPAANLQAALLELMKADNNYSIAYRAAFESQPETILPELAVPMYITAAAGDALQEHLGRLRDLPSNVEARPAASRAETLERSLRHLLAHRGDPAPAPVATRPIGGRLWSRMINVAGGQARVRLQLGGGGEPVLLLHGAGGSSATVSRLATGVHDRHPVVIPDLPGHGESAPARAGGPTVSDCADTALRVLGDTGISQAVLVGQGAGACVALETRRRGSLKRPRIALIDVPYLDSSLSYDFEEEGVPTLEPQWHGGHLLFAWHMLRDGRLFFPWFQRNRAAALRGEPDLDPQRLTLELRELLSAAGAWQSLLRDALDYPLPQALRDAGDSCLLAAPGAGPWESATRRAAELVPALRFVHLPADPAAWLPLLVA